MSHQTKTPAKHFAAWLKSLSKGDKIRQQDIATKNTRRIIATAPNCNLFHNMSERSD